MSDEAPLANADSGFTPRRRTARADKASFAKRLGQLVHGRGNRQSDLARDSGLDPKLISSYMLGKAVPGKTNAIKVARALGVSVSDLIPDDAPDTDSYGDASPMQLIMSRDNPSISRLRINMNVRTELGSEIIRLLLKDRETA